LELASLLGDLSDLGLELLILGLELILQLFNGSASLFQFSLKGLDFLLVSSGSNGSGGLRILGVNQENGEATTTNKIQCA